MASQSRMRAHIIADMNISFVLVDQQADEHAVDHSLPLASLVHAIARHKMNQVLLPTGAVSQQCYVLTADTLTADSTGAILSKPQNNEEAFAMVEQLQQGVQIATAFCLDKKVWRYEQWQIEERVHKTVEAFCRITIPLDKRAAYLKNTHALQAAGALQIEGYGAQFVEEIQGSYTAILGLPAYEVRQALEQLQFYR